MTYPFLFVEHLIPASYSMSGSSYDSKLTWVASLMIQKEKETGKDRSLQRVCTISPRLWNLNLAVRFLNRLEICKGITPLLHHIVSPLLLFKLIVSLCAITSEDAPMEPNRRHHWEGRAWATNARQHREGKHLRGDLNVCCLGTKRTREFSALFFTVSSTLSEITFFTWWW